MKSEQEEWYKKGGAQLLTPVLVGELISWCMVRPDWLLILEVSRCGSRMSRYLETMRTEMKYTTAKARNWACLLSSCGEVTTWLCYSLFRQSYFTQSTATASSGFLTARPRKHIESTVFNRLQLSEQEHIWCFTCWLKGVTLHTCLSLFTSSVPVAKSLWHACPSTDTHIDPHSPHHETPQRAVDWCPHPAEGDQGPWWETGY